MVPVSVNVPSSTMVTSASSTASSPACRSTRLSTPAAVITHERAWLDATLLDRRFPSMPGTAPARPLNSSAKVSSLTSIPAGIAWQHRHRLAIHLENARADGRHLPPAQLGQHALGRRPALLDQLEILDGGSSEADFLSLEGLESFGRRQPLELDDLVAVDSGLLPRRDLSGEEARVEADGLLFGRDPVSEIRHAVGGQGQPLRSQHVEEGGVGLLRGGPVGGIALAAVRGDPEKLAVRSIGEEDAHLLEGFPDGADPVGEGFARRETTAQSGGRRSGGEPSAEAFTVHRHVVGLDLSAGEDIVSGGELALGVTLEQEGLDGGGRTIAQENESGGGGRGHGLGHGAVSRIVTHEGVTCPSTCYPGVAAKTSARRRAAVGCGAPDDGWARCCSASSWLRAHRARTHPCAGTILRAALAASATSTGSPAPSTDLSSISSASNRREPESHRMGMRGSRGRELQRALSGAVGQ